MGDLSSFFDMGGYGAFVWPAFLLSALMLGGLLIATLTGMRRSEAEVQQLQSLRRQQRAEAKP